MKSIHTSCMLAILAAAAATSMTMGNLSLHSVVAQPSEDNYVLPVVLVYPSLWVEKDTIPPAIEVRVLDQTQEDSVLDTAEGDEKRALDQAYSIKYFEIPKNAVNVGEEIEVCISPVGTEDYPSLSQCSTATVGEAFQVIPVFLIE